MSYTYGLSCSLAGLWKTESASAKEHSAILCLDILIAKAETVQLQVHKNISDLVISQVSPAALYSSTSTIKIDGETSKIKNQSKNSIETDSLEPDSFSFARPAPASAGANPRLRLSFVPLLPSPPLRRRRRAPPGKARSVQAAAGHLSPPLGVRSAGCGTRPEARRSRGARRRRGSRARRRRGWLSWLRRLRGLWWRGGACSVRLRRPGRRPSDLAAAARLIWSAVRCGPGWRGLEVAACPPGGLGCRRWGWALRARTGGQLRVAGCQHP